MTDTAKLIYDFVAENYGKDEADEPSWSIPHLADAIDNRTGLYMVIASFRSSIRDNYEIVGHNLSLEDAKQLCLDIQFAGMDENSMYNNEDWELDYRDKNYIKIVPQAVRI